MEVCAGDSIGTCNSKTACKNTLFPCPTTSAGCDDTDELASVVSSEGCKTTLLEGSGLVWACVGLFVGPAVLGEEVSGVVWEEMVDFLTFSCF